MSGLSDSDDRLVQMIRRAGLGGAAAALMEGLRPLALVAAQLAYVTGPFWGGTARWASLAHHLEDNDDLDHVLSSLLDDEAAS